MSHDANPLLDRELLFVTGKGGVGKTTVAAGIGMALAAAGHRTIVCEVGTAHRMPSLMGAPEADAKHPEVEVAPGLWASSVDPERALRDWLANQLGSRSLVQVLTRSNIFHYFVAAAPGARELVTVTKVWELAQTKRWRKEDRPYDRVVVDLPASGHAVGMLRTPRTFADIARVGPIASQAGAVRRSIEDPAQTGIVVVTLPGELPVTETLELEDKVTDALHRDVDLVVVNALLDTSFSELELTAVGGTGVPTVARRAVRSEAARAVEHHEQLDRLRDGARARVVTLPFLARDVLTATDVGELGDTLAGQL